MIGFVFSTQVPAPAQAVVFKSHGGQATLVELYSSEGCSSCPPAEAWISNLKTAPGLFTSIFPVVFHVDYWDGLGWPDRFARPAYTERQRQYAARLGQDSVYTPEFVASGREWRGWFDGDRRPPSAGHTDGDLSVNVEDGGAKVSAEFTPSVDSSGRRYVMNIALLGVGIESDVKSGENGGRQLRHDFVVLDFKSQPLTKAGGFKSGTVELAPSSGDSPGALVAWVSADDGSIVQVAGGWLHGSATGVAEK